MTNLLNPPVQVNELARFAAHRSVHGSVDGTLCFESAATWDAFLSRQSSMPLKGHLLEIGVGQGQSAMLLARHSDPQSEVVVLVDKELDAPAVEEALHNVYANLGDSFQLLHMDSRRLVLDPLMLDGFECFRWIHIDGERSLRAVSHDLSIANTLLADQGIVCIGSYFDVAYPQVTEAVHRYVYEHPDQFALFLGGYQKAYLARPHHVHAWLGYCKNELVVDLEARGVEVSLTKTTLPTEMNTFGMVPRIYGNRMRGPDWDPTAIHI